MKRRYLNDDQSRWVRDWWKAMQPSDPSQPPAPLPLRGLKRAARAQLKRCQSMDALLLEAALYPLAKRWLDEEAKKPYPHFAGDYVVVALVAGVLAGVRDDLPNGASLVTLANDDTRALSEQRFLRLLRTTDIDDFYLLLQRAVQLAGRKVNVVRLADDIVAWYVERNHPVSDPNHALKARWARDYYLSLQEREAADQANPEIPE
jgi:CRISPR system Cascade subunit CasB